MDAALWILVALPFAVAAGLFVWELFGLRASAAGRNDEPGGRDDLAPAVRRGGAAAADSPHADDEYAWEDRPATPRRPAA